VDLPESAIILYKENLNKTTKLIEGILAEFTNGLLNDLQVATHQLAGTCAYFGDDKLGLSSKKLM